MAKRCCYGCVAPKRYSGCHDHCPERAKEKALDNEKKAAGMIQIGIMEQMIAGINRAKKKNRQKRNGWKRGR